MRPVRRIRIRWQMLLMLALPLLLSGCMLSASVEDLYVLPQLPGEYKNLSDQIDEILANGAEYTSPTAGTNLQSVQLMDLDGDGNEEALAFFRNASEESPLKIYIFRSVGDTYEQAAVIDGSGTSIHSIQYVDMDGNGIQEILVAWQVSAEVQTMCVYSMADLEPVQLMSSAYSRYEVVDLDEDDVQELLVVRSDESESGATSLADYYDWDGRSLLLKSTAKLSMSVAELQWVETGMLEGGETAVFITGRVTGVEETSRAVTDILAYREPDLTNIVLNSATGVSSEIFRFLNLQPTDINNDGVTEVPMPAGLPGEGGEEAYWKIYWRSYTVSGEPQHQAITYHNLTDSWYLTVPEEWDGHFTVRQDNTSTTEHATTFYSTTGDTVEEELLTIYTLTGTDREAQAVKNGRTILRRQPTTVYAVRFAPGYSQWRYAIGESDLTERFSAIVTQWNMEDN